MQNLNKKLHIKCPMHEVIATTPYDLKHLEPILNYLTSNKLPKTDPIQFTVGAISANGKLDMCKQALGVQGIQLIADALGKNKSIKHVLFGTNGMGDIGANTIAHLLQQNKTIETMYLGCNLISEIGVTAIADSLNNNTTLKGLWMKRNPIGNGGVSALKNSIKNNCSLRTVDLVNIGLSNTGMQELFFALQHNISIQFLYISGNGLLAKDMPWLALLVTENNIIEGLFLSINPIGNDGLAILAAALQNNIAVKNIGMASCGITTAGLYTFLEYAAKNKTLQHVDFGFANATNVLGGLANDFGDLDANKFLRLLDTCVNLKSINLVKTQIPELVLQQLQNANLKCKIILDGAPSFKSSNLHADATVIKSVYR